MPIHKKDGGYQWGSKGKVYPTREGAEKQAKAAYANGYRGDTSKNTKLYRSANIDTNFDYSGSVRKEVDFGRLEITRFPISKEDVNEYRGREIPGFEDLGLDPNKIYRLYRPAEELKKAAPTFNKVPITVEHPTELDTPFTPQDRQGATGSDTDFESPYLYTSALLWDAPAIEGLANGTRKEVSIFSTFDVEMQPGLFQGKPYDGIIRNIRGNSVALTIAGRAGNDVAVGDSKIEGKLMEDIKKLMRDRFTGASDSEIDEVHREVMRLIKENNSQHNTIEDDLDKLSRQHKTLERGHGDNDDDCGTYAGDSEEERKKMREDRNRRDNKEDNREDRERGERKNEDERRKERTDKSLEDDKEDEARKHVGDSAVSAIVAKAVEAAQRNFAETLQAMRLVQPRYGQVVGDSAEEIYREVLKHEKINTDGVPTAAYRALVETVMDYKSKTTPTAVGDSAYTSRATAADFKDYL